MRRLVINGEEIYELDEECIKEKKRKEEKERKNKKTKSSKKQIR